MYARLKALPGWLAHLLDRHHHRHQPAEGYEGMPTAAYYYLGGLILLLLFLVIIAEPYANRERLAQNHPPGSPPVFTDPSR